MADPDRYIFPKGKTPGTGRKYRFIRRVPKDIQPFLDKAGELPADDTIRLSLKTRDLAEARLRRDEIEAAQDLYWDGLLKGETDASKLYQRALMIARRARVPYKTAAQIADPEQTSTAELVRRLNLTFDSPDPKTAALGVLGGAEKPRMQISDVLRYWKQKIAPRERSGRSEVQFRRYVTTRERAASQLIEAVGDVLWEDLGRDQALGFRDWLQGRVDPGQINVETGDRQLSYVQGLWTAYGREIGERAENPFRGLKLTGKAHKANRRQSVPIDIIRSWLEPGALDHMNAQARDILLTLIDTNCRGAEIAGLDEEDIFLTGNIPHIWIRPNRWRSLKTKSSERKMPLVGQALEAIRRNPAGFPRYREKPQNLSATLHKGLRSKGLLPDHLTIYGLRHAWKDRAITGGADPELREVLMGHAVSHVVYGEQGSLEDRLRVMEVAAA